MAGSKFGPILEYPHIRCCVYFYMSLLQSLNKPAIDNCLLAARQGKPCRNYEISAGGQSKACIARRMLVRCDTGVLEAKVIAELLPKKP